MKKVLTLLAFLALFVNCDKTDVNHDEGTSNSLKKVSTTSAMKSSPSLLDNPECDFFDPIEKLSIEQQIVWLKNNETKICGDKDLKVCITDLHHMNQEDYDAALLAYWGTAVPKLTEFKLEDFVNSSNPCTYSSYLVFDYDVNDNIFFTKQSSFSTTRSSYSIPFFEGLSARYNLVGSSKLSFTKGIVNAQTVVLVSVNGVTDANFDYSHYPGGKGASCNPIKDKEYRSPQLRQSYGKDS